MLPLRLRNGAIGASKDTISVGASLGVSGESGASPLVVCSNPKVRRLMDFAVIARTVTIFDRVSDPRHALIEQTADALAS